MSAKPNFQRNANTYSTHLYRHTRLMIGENIRAQRMKHGLTLRRLSRLTGISIELLDQYEMGKNEISLRELLKIGCVLGVGLIEIAQP